MSRPTPARPAAGPPELEIQDLSAFILRAGVVASVVVMLLGLALSFARGAPSVGAMETLRFSTDFAAIAAGCAALDGPSWIELGVLLLVLTPILRVAGSMVLFLVEERDWVYGAITAAVLLLTLLSLLVVR